MSPEKEPVTRKAWAKINLTFEVLGKRPDGYHEVLSIMQAISLCDVLTFEPGDDIRLACDVAELVSPNNLVYRAARLMQGFARGSRGVAITLRKGIPLASGLGGGSSDAAATLQALNGMWNINLSQEALADVAAQLGSDVAFFVGDNTTAMAAGRGEKVQALPRLARTWLVLLRPPIELANKTRQMYAHLDPAAYTRGQHSKRLAAVIRRQGAVTNRQCFNAFDPLSLALFPGLEGFRRQLIDAGAEEVHLAGAGPTMFTLASSRDEGESILRRMGRHRAQAWLAETI